MKHNITRHCIALTALFTLPALSLLPSKAQAQFMPLKTMSFQGHLTNPNGTPVADNATTQITFSIWDNPTVGTGTQLWTSSLSNISVTNGNFAVKLDFTTGFTSLNTLTSVFNGSAIYLQIVVNGAAPLSPRQPLLANAYAILASTALTVPDGSLTSSKFAPNLLNPLAWLLGGNSGVSNGFIGTTDNNPLDFRVNNQRGLRLEWAVSNQINVIGGYSVNSVSAGVYGAVIAGGGYPNFPNRVTDYGGAVSGGAANTAGNDDNDTGNAPEATVSGGFGNTARGRTSVVSGGVFNLASGDFGVVPGGNSNTAGGFTSFAAGRRAKANHDGTFVWGDDTDADFASTGINQFLIRAAGGVGIGTNTPQAKLDVNGTARVTGFQLPTGAAVNRVLLSDGAGNGSWQPISNSLLQGVGWSLTGNSGTNAVSNFLGTTDNVPLEIRVNGRRAMRYQYAEFFNERSINVLGGSDINSIKSGVIGATIAGGGEDVIVETPNGDPPQVDGPNRVTGDYGAIGGGGGNSADLAATVGGGFHNVASGYCATVAGGFGSTASGLYSFAVGSGNTASGTDSFAAGTYASAKHKGTFVWCDNNGGGISSTGDNQFLIRAAGGVGINNNAPAYALDIVGGANAVNGPTSGRLANGTFGVFGTNSAGDGIQGQVSGTGHTNGNSGVAGIDTVSGYYGLLGNRNYGVYSNGPAGGTSNWMGGSDARYKMNVATLNNALDTVLNLRGVNYDWDRAKWPGKSFPEGRQVGFIAQEIEKFLPEVVGTDAQGYKSVAYGSVVPVLVEAIKTLNAKVDDQQKQIDELKALNTTRGKEIDALKKQNDRIAELEKSLANVLTTLKQAQTTPNVARK